MIISRTPFRVSFFGGGTDYPKWYQENGGKVLTSTINKYCYITARYLPPFFDKKNRIVWSRIETVNEHNEICHPVVREVLKILNIQDGVEIHHNGDLPAKSGLGSSSAFTVGLLNSLHSLNGVMKTKISLAEEAINIEQNILKEAVGVQDQIEVAHGGLNVIDINRDGSFRVTPLIVSRARVEELENHLMLFFTGVSRFASDIAQSKINEIPNNSDVLKKISSFVDNAIEILTSNNCISDFGELLHASWSLKKKLSSKVSNNMLDEIYNTALQAGAIGGKLLGAGGGGFFLIFAKPADQPRIKNALNGFLEVPFKFESSGSQIIFADI